MADSKLILENGMIFEGNGFGAKNDAVFELVFNTSMTGYQEIMTDPSYRGQGVLFTVPHIGNVGINREDYEAKRPQVSAIFIRSISQAVSNWRAKAPLSDWLELHHVPGISGIDTRRITRVLRSTGTMKAAMTTIGTDVKELMQLIKGWPGLDGIDMVQEVTCDEPYNWMPDGAFEWVKNSRVNNEFIEDQQKPLVILYDFGAKQNIARNLAVRNMRVMIVPAYTPFSDLARCHPKGIVLSNGPGDPKGLPEIVDNVKSILAEDIPVLGICLGHQLLGLAVGGETGRLKFGHHGGNHPVLNIETGETWITSQNHNFAVVKESLNPNQVKTTHISLNDGTVEGMVLLNKSAISVQFHPEASPGPNDALTIFDQFQKMVEGNI
jgi:carbamoyl-phosphate synthase small subunit